MRARERGKRYYIRALGVFADYAMGFISKKEAERRLRKLAGVNDGR